MEMAAACGRRLLAFLLVLHVLRPATPNARSAPAFCPSPRPDMAARWWASAPAPRAHVRTAIHLRTASGRRLPAGLCIVTLSSKYTRALTFENLYQDPETARLEAAALGLAEWKVKGALQLLADGGTVPFIARYRKEVTGAMDETQLRSLLAGLERRQKVGDRRGAIMDSLAKAQLLTPPLTQALNAATSLAELEDIYLPLRPKRTTRASAAVDKGLEDLALVMMGRYLCVCVCVCV